MSLDPTILTRGFCEPILWGVRHAYSVGEIAEGLGLEERTVIRAIELNSGVEVPRPPQRRRRPAEIDPRRTDASYVAWRRSREGASDTLDGVHG